MQDNLRDVRYSRACVCQLSDIAREHTQGAPRTVYRRFNRDVLVFVDPSSDGRYFCEREEQSVSIACIPQITKAAAGAITQCN